LHGANPVAVTIHQILKLIRLARRSDNPIPRRKRRLGVSSDHHHCRPSNYRHCLASPTLDWFDDRKVDQIGQYRQSHFLPGASAEGPVKCAPVPVLVRDGLTTSNRQLSNLARNRPNGN
jgi:hypothetical protein